MRLIFRDHPLIIDENIQILLSRYGLYRRVSRVNRRRPEFAIYNPEWACKLAIKRRKRFHAAEPVIFTNAKWGYKYIKAFDIGRLESFEKILLSHPKWAYKYLRYLEYDSVVSDILNTCISKDPKWAYKKLKYNYCDDKAIYSHPKWACKYSILEQEYDLEKIERTVSKSPKYQLMFLMEQNIKLDENYIDTLYKCKAGQIQIANNIQYDDKHYSDYDHEYYHRIIWNLLPSRKYMNLFMNSIICSFSYSDEYMKRILEPIPNDYKARYLLDLSKKGKLIDFDNAYMVLREEMLNTCNRYNTINEICNKFEN
jgi:hypothetical protein